MRVKNLEPYFEPVDISVIIRHREYLKAALPYLTSLRFTNENNDYGGHEDIEDKISEEAGKLTLLYLANQPEEETKLPRDLKEKIKDPKIIKNEEKRAEIVGELLNYPEAFETYENLTKYLQDIATINVQRTLKPYAGAEANYYHPTLPAKKKIEVPPTETPEKRKELPLWKKIAYAIAGASLLGAALTGGAIAYAKTGHDKEIIELQKNLEKIPVINKISDEYFSILGLKDKDKDGILDINDIWPEIYNFPAQKYAREKGLSEEIVKELAPLNIHNGKPELTEEAKEFIDYLASVPQEEQKYVVALLKDGRIDKSDMEFIKYISQFDNEIKKAFIKEFLADGKIDVDEYEQMLFLEKYTNDRCKTREEKENLMKKLVQENKIHDFNWDKDKNGNNYVEYVLGNGNPEKYDYKVLVMCFDPDLISPENVKDFLKKLEPEKYFDKIYTINFPLVTVVDSYKELSKYPKPYRDNAIILARPDPVTDKGGYIVVPLGLYDFEKALEDISKMPENTIKVFALEGHGFPGPLLQDKRVLKVLSRLPGKGNNSYWIIVGCGAYRHVEREMIPCIPNATMFYSATDDGGGDISMLLALKGKYRVRDLDKNGYISLYEAWIGGIDINGNGKLDENEPCGFKMYDPLNKTKNVYLIPERVISDVEGHSNLPVVTPIPVGDKPIPPQIKELRVSWSKS